MKKSTKIIASIAATFVIIASIATVSLFKTDDSQVVPTTTLIVGTTLLPTQPLETVSAFDWEAYLNSQELSSETELSTEDPTATTIPSSGFSCVFADKIIPDAVVSSASTCFNTTLSPNGINFMMTPP